MQTTLIHLIALLLYRYTGGLTATGKALQTAKQLYSSSSSGARKKATRIVLVITDGRTTVGIKPKEPANQLRAPPLSAKTYALGIGFNINSQELLDIAGSSGNVFRARSYRDLRRIAYYFGCKYCAN